MNEDTTPSPSPDSDSSDEFPLIEGLGLIQSDMLRQDDTPRLQKVDPLRRTSDISPARKQELAGVIAAFGLEPEENIWPRLNRAFVHRSFRTEQNLDEDNERLEFLGDSVIGLSATEYILRLYPANDEGWLSKLRATIVSRAILGEIAREMGMGSILLLGTGEERSGGRDRVSTLGSTLEAVCGALYLHYPWYELREPLRRTVLIPALELARKNHVADYKSKLQEWSQKAFQKVPDYRVVQEGGPDHDKVFEVEVVLDGRILGRGHGRRKKQAENDAARHALNNRE